MALKRSLESTLSSAVATVPVLLLLTASQSVYAEVTPKTIAVKQSANWRVVEYMDVQQPSTYDFDVYYMGNLVVTSFSIFVPKSYHVSTEGNYRHGAKVMGLSHFHEINTNKLKSVQFVLSWTTKYHHQPLSERVTLPLKLASSRARVLAKNPSIIPNSADSKSIAKTLRAYLNAFNVGDLAKAYSMFADMKQHMSLKKWEAQGDPQKGWRPVLTSVYAVQQDSVAEAYTKMTILPPNQSKRQNFLFVYPLIKQGGTWKMVSDESDFGSYKYAVFKKLDKASEAYGEKHPMNG